MSTHEDEKVHVAYACTFTPGRDVRCEADARFPYRHSTLCPIFLATESVRLPRGSGVDDA